MLPFQAKVDLGAMAKKGYSAFPKFTALLRSHHHIVLCHTQETHFLPLCREAVGVFYFDKVPKRNFYVRYVNDTFQSFAFHNRANKLFQRLNYFRPSVRPYNLQ